MGVLGSRDNLFSPHLSQSSLSPTARVFPLGPNFVTLRETFCRSPSQADIFSLSCCEVCRCQAGEDPCHTLFQVGDGLALAVLCRLCRGWASHECSMVPACQSCLVELPSYARSSRHAVLCDMCRGQPLHKEWDSGLGQVSFGAECVPTKDPSPVPISLAELCQYEVVHHPLVTGPRYFPLEAMCDMQLHEPLVIGGGHRPTGTQSSCRSRRTRRRRNRMARPLKAREPLESAIVAWTTTAPYENKDKWAQLAGLAFCGFTQRFQSVESSMVGLFEDDEPTDRLTLEYLVVHKMFQALASSSPNPSDWVFVLRGSEDLSANSCDVKPRNLKVCSANVTRWRSSHRKWVHTLSPDILMLQELHLTTWVPPTGLSLCLN